MLRNIVDKAKSEKGSMFIITLFVMVIFLGFGAALMVMVTNEARVSERQRLSTVAFGIAEAGLERGLFRFRNDFVNATGTPSWIDSDIDGMNIGPDSNGFYAVEFENAIETDGKYVVPLNGGSYYVDCKNVSGSDSIWISSTGMINGVSHTILAYAKIVNASPWNTAIFAGAGASNGSLINGQVDIRGSVHILGNGLNPGAIAVELAMDISGSSYLGNNYNGLDAGLAALVPALPTVTFNGETVETLNATLRIKKGIMGVSGSAEVGSVDLSGNAVKETVDGVYVTDGWGGNKGTASVHSDNGTANCYDMGDAVSFPSLSDISKEDASKTFQEYYKTQALVLTDELAGIDPNSSFIYTDGTNSIVMNGGHITVTGKVYVSDNNEVNFIPTGGNSDITYSGSGTILAEGNINIETNLRTVGNNSFPNNIVGFMTPNDLVIGTSAQLEVMGLFYAENQITINKQTKVMGTIVSNFFDMGGQVPDIYQVPETVNFMPDGMILGEGMFLSIVSWQKV